MASIAIEDVFDWGRVLDAVASRIGVRFAGSETRDRVLAHLVGLLGPMQRKSGGQVARPKRIPPHQNPVSQYSSSGRHQSRSASNAGSSWTTEPIAGHSV